ncbi:MAG: winged helix-turn-helix domain-containing protein [Archaeoglobaceae archaeon]
MKKRTRFDIIFEILRISLGREATKAKIIKEANINSKMAEKYINFMLENDLLRESLRYDKRVFKTTEKGNQLLNEFDGVINVTMHRK